MPPEAIELGRLEKLSGSPGPFGLPPDISAGRGEPLLQISDEQAEEYDAGAKPGYVEHGISIDVWVPPQTDCARHGSACGSQGSRSAMALCTYRDLQVYKSRDQLTKAATTGHTDVAARCCSSCLKCDRVCHTSRFVMLAEKRSWPKRNDKPNKPNWMRNAQ